MSEILISPSCFQLLQLNLSHKRLEESRPFAEVESWKPYLTFERYKSGSFFSLQPVGCPWDSDFYTRFMLNVSVSQFLSVYS